MSNHIQDLLTDTDEFYEEPSPFASAGGGRYNFDPDDLEPDSGNEFDFTVPDSAAALNEQAISRVFIKLDSAMPKLGSLGSFLSMVTTLHPDNVIRAESCRNHLLHLAAPYTIHHLSSYPPFVICFSIYGFSGASCPISPSEARLSSHRYHSHIPGEEAEQEKIHMAFTSGTPFLPPLPPLPSPPLPYYC